MILNGISSRPVKCFIYSHIIVINHKFWFSSKSCILIVEWKDCLAFIKSLGEKETNVVGEPKKKFLDFETVYLPMVSTTNYSNIMDNLPLIQF